MSSAEGLRAMRALLGELGMALERERRALSTLDADLLDEVNRDKASLAAEIAALRPRIRSDQDGDEALRASVGEAANAVRLAAQANTMLLANAAELVGQVLGTGGRPASYDRMARTVRGPRISYAKVV